MVERIPIKPVGDKITNTWDKLLAEGEAKGIKIGEARGEAKGEAKGIIVGEAKGITKGQKLADFKKSIVAILQLANKMPHWKNKNIAEICQVSTKFVKKVKAVFFQNKKKKVKKFVRKTFKIVPNMKETDFLKIEKFALKQWKKNAPLQNK